MKKCIICSKEFETGVSQTECSLKCRKKKYYLNRLKIIGPRFTWKEKRNCLICEKDFIPNVENQLFCSLECVAKNRNNKKRQRRINSIKSQICGYCKKEFMPHQKGMKFCSKQCMIFSYCKTGGVKNPGFRGTMVKCKMCGIDFSSYTPTQKWCSKKCRRKADYQNNYFTKIMAVMRRKLRKKNLGGSFTKEQWNTLVKKYNGACWMCKIVKKLTIDHIVPISKWSKWIINHPEITYRCGDVENIQPLCWDCNIKIKGSKILS